MRGTPRLSNEQLQAFHRDGFLVMPGMFSAKQTRELRAWTDELAAWPETPGRHMMYFESSAIEPGKRILNRLENFSPYHDGFARMINGPLLDAVTQLFGEPAVLFKDKINFKLPGGGGFAAHQDVQAGWDVYATLHITALLSIDPCTTENGCLEIAAGHHTRGLIGSAWQPLDSAALDGEYKPLETQPGDAVFFDSFTPHRSAPNQSALPRRVLYVTYNRLAEGDQRARYYQDKRNSYPPDCERDPGKQYVFRV